jgi:hypothetical protein
MVGDSPFCRNAKEIGQYIGIDGRRIPEFKELYGLPVWRFSDGGPWRALKSSLDLWLKDMEKEHLKTCQ